MLRPGIPKGRFSFFSPGKINRHGVENLPLQVKLVVLVMVLGLCFAIIVSVFYSNKSIVKQIDSIKTSSIENYIDEGFIDLKSYEVLALLDDEDIVNIDLESNIFSEESLENYLLEKRIEETFLIE